jgi:hypothetical protein
LATFPLFKPLGEMEQILNRRIKHWEGGAISEEQSKSQQSSSRTTGSLSLSLSLSRSRSHSHRAPR